MISNALKFTNTGGQISVHGKLIKRIEDLTYGSLLPKIHWINKFEYLFIGVVECMAAGLVTVAHNSAGPKMDSK